MSNVTTHRTAEGEVLFMFAQNPLRNKQTGEESYTIKLKMDESNPDALAVKEHLLEIADYKITTKTNMKLNGEFVVNFSSAKGFAPKVLDAEGNELENSDIPRFDGRKDQARAIVDYIVIDYGDKKIVRLAGIQITSLNLAEEESGEDLDSVRAKLKNL